MANTQKNAPVHTTKIVDFIVNSRFDEIPAKALKVAREAILDCVGVAVAGSIEPAGRLTADWARAAAGARQSLRLGTRLPNIRSRCSAG